MINTYTAADVSVAIPSYGRDQVLIDTVKACLEQRHPPGELIIVDQTATHSPEVAAELQHLSSIGKIRREFRSQPSQPAALNHALQIATKPLILFLDDDIVPCEGFIAAHAAAFNEHPYAWAVVGQILQPGETPTPLSDNIPQKGLRADIDFPFRSNEQAWVANVMSGNLSVLREKALAIGGFDENFLGVAYRFDTEFGRRLIGAGGKVLFEPKANIRHLRAQRGGTRSTGSHLTSASPVHGMGDYYFAMRSGLRAETLGYMLYRPFREVATRFHLRHPWYIPVKLFGEARAFCAAAQAFARGPRLIQTTDNLEPPIAVAQANEAIQ